MASRLKTNSSSRLTITWSHDLASSRRRDADTVLTCYQRPDEDAMRSALERRTKVSGDV